MGWTSNLIFISILHVDLEVEVAQLLFESIKLNIAC